MIPTSDLEATRILLQNHAKNKVQFLNRNTFQSVDKFPTNRAAIVRLRENKKSRKCSAAKLPGNNEHASNPQV